VVLLYPEHQFDPPVPAPQVTVRDNVVEMMHAGNYKAALACLGGCSNSLWTNNVVSGFARYGVLVSDFTADLYGFAVTPLGGPVGNTFTGNRSAGGMLVDPAD
jgi:hypothetical protein